MDRKYFECMTELGLEPGFTEKDLRKNWLELLKKYHPDKYQTEDESIIKFAEEKIIKINEAYEYLKENFDEDNEELSNTIDYDYEKYTDDYSENKFWDKFKEGAKKIGLKATSYALILYYVLCSERIFPYDSWTYEDYLPSPQLKMPHANMLFSFPHYLLIRPLYQFS